MPSSRLTEPTASHRPFLSALSSVSATQWTLVVFALLLARAAADGLAPLIDAFGDPDDAMRLVQARALLAGQGWFDTVPTRLDPAHPVALHWSRLLDAPIAWMIRLAALVTPMERAEAAARLVWPQFLFGLTLALCVRFARAAYGRGAALFTLAFAATSLSAQFQFAPGRIDHHNALILCACGGFFLALQGLTTPRLARWGGAVSGLGLSIGLEGLPLTAVAAGGLALAAVSGRRFAAPAAAFARALALALALALAATSRMSALLPAPCDANGVNLAALAAIGAAGLTALERLAFAERDGARGVLVAVTAALGLALYLAMEPACLAGPFGKVDPAIRPIWLDHVREARSILFFMRDAPAAAFAFLATVFLAVLAQAAFAWRARGAADTLLAVALTLLALLACWQIKLAPYASWLALPALGRFAANLPRIGQARAGVVRLCAVLCLSQTTLVFVANAVAPRAESGDALSDAGRCATREALAPLHALAPGLVAAPVDLGAHLLVFTPHSVLSAPYHRFASGMIASHAVLASAPERARALLAEHRVDYVLDCAAMPPVLHAEKGGLQERLRVGETFDFLDPMPVAEGLSLWRVRR